MTRSEQSKQASACQTGASAAASRFRLGMLVKCEMCPDNAVFAIIGQDKSTLDLRIRSFNTGNVYIVDSSLVTPID